MSSCCTVARDTCTPLPRMLISRSSSVIVFVGYDTLMVSPPVKNGFTRWRSGDIICIRQMSDASGGTVTRSCCFRNAPASSARFRIRAGWPPAGTYLFFTASSAFSQSSPNPSSRDAFFISPSHHAYSRLPISINCSGVYGIISPARSSRRPSRPIGSPTISSSDAAGSEACPPRPAPRPPPAPGPAAMAGAAPASPPIFWRMRVEYAVSAFATS